MSQPSKSPGRLSCLIGSVVAALLLSLAGASAASAETVWNLDLHHNPTHFPPGGTGTFWVDVGNVGGTASSGTTVLTISLPNGLTRNSVKTNEFDNLGSVSWSCPGSSGATTITCTTSSLIPRHRVSRAINVKVDVAAGASGTRFATASVSGGGAAAAASTFEAVELNSAPADFGIVDDTFTGDFYAADGLTTVRQAGGHPDLASFTFDITTVSEDTVVDGGDPDQPIADHIRNLRVDLPEGFIGDPTAVAECTPAGLLSNACPPASQVGRIDATLSPLSSSCCSQAISTGVYNMTPPEGVIADLAFKFAGNPIHIVAALDPKRNYAVSTRVRNVNESLVVYNQHLTLWGYPADPAHDSERCAEFQLGSTDRECVSDGPREPFLTMPFQCGAEGEMKLSGVESWENSGDVLDPITYPLPGTFTGCDDVPFEPSGSVEPTETEADTPTGLDVTVAVTQNQDPDGIAASPLKDAVVTLPEGMATNPAAADGLKACSEDEIGLGTDDPVACPNASKIGQARLITPVLPDPVSGSVYLAEQGNKGPAQGSNPFDSLLAMYLVLKDKDRGLLVKLPGKIEADPETGQLTTRFTENPQLPFSELRLRLKDGNRAPLVTPPTCGTKTATAEFTPWARPGDTSTESDSFAITSGAGGGPCPATLAGRPFDPAMPAAGTLDSTAGGFSPFVFRLTREDGQQEFLTTTVTPPEGLTAKLAGVPLCDSGDAAAGSCPAGSQVGIAIVGAGAGHPFYIRPPGEGRVYMAGPYDPDGDGDEPEAPLSMLIQVPAVAGPFDLGMVDVRAAVYVDPRTAQLTVVSDELPQIIEGIPLRVRDIRIRIDREGFTINPTDCDGKRVGAVVGGSQGAEAELAKHFQASGCGALNFGPKLNLRYRGKGATKRNAHPRLAAGLKIPGAASVADGSGATQTNISKVRVTLPRATYLDQDSLSRVCTPTQWAAESCPSDSMIGTAKAWSPLLDEPLAGPVYLKVGPNKLPDLAADLNGIVDIDLFGRIDQSKGRIRNTFDVVPDVPVERFRLNLKGGKGGLLVNSRDICTGKKALRRANVAMSAHNGAKLAGKQMVVKCGGKKPKSKKRTRKGAHRKHRRR